MKNFLVIGLGRFGMHLSHKLAQLGNDVMVVDENEALVNRMLPEVTCAQVADCKDESVLESLSVGSFDICFVCIGDDFQSSLEITSLLKDFGAKMVVSKAATKIQEKFLLRNGADAVVYPEKDVAYKLAVQYSGKNLYDYYKLSNDISIYEIGVPKSWVGRSIRKIDVRKIHGINILATKVNGVVKLSDIDYQFQAEDHILVIGSQEAVNKIAKGV